jgi:hypothetical protein
LSLFVQIFFTTTTIPSPTTDLAWGICATWCLCPTGQNAAKSNGQALGICQAAASIVNELGKVLKVH